MKSAVVEVDFHCIDVMLVFGGCHCWLGGDVASSRVQIDHRSCRGNCCSACVFRSLGRR